MSAPKAYSGTMSLSVERHCYELNRCNQRGGRMLSIFDLLDAGSLDLDLATYLMAEVTLGASFMVGAFPGGAGKTTVMCALLNLVPPEVELVAVTPEAVHNAHTVQAQPQCLICHEIGPGRYFSYLWDDALRTYCGLSEQGYQLATNLHANDLPQARKQVCEVNRVPFEQFNRFELMIFLRMSNGIMGTTRRIDKVYASDGIMPHTLVYKHGQGLALELTAQENAWRTQCRAFLEAEYRNGVRTIEQVRERVMEFMGLAT